MSFNIGIEEKGRKAVADALATLLADTYSIYLKTQNFHWNVTGPNFSSLHSLFEDQYNELAETVDEIAERIRALGFSSPGSFGEFVKLSSIKDAKSGLKSPDMIKQLIEDRESVVRYARDQIEMMQSHGDEATADMLIAQLAMHEKAVWMLNSSL